MKKHFKKLLLMALMAVMAVGLIACGTDKSDNESTKEEKTSVTITSLDSSKNEIELEVPYNPKRIAILDLASLDIIDELGVGDRVVGMASTSIDYLEKYSNASSIKNLGTIKEADLEAFINIVQNCSEEAENVDINAVCNADKCIITIKDDGNGIAKDKLDNIFNRFESGKSYNSLHTGIGLNLSKLIIEAHHGSVSVNNNEDGRGVSFRIIIPKYNMKRKAK